MNSAFFSESHEILGSRPMTKEAVIPGLSALLTGAGGHFGVNALGRNAHNTTNLAEVLAHKGFQHGATGSRMSHMAERSMNALLGPEVGAQYHAARYAGEKLYAMPPAERAHALSMLSGGEGVQGALGVGADALKSMKDAPIFPAIQKAVGHDVAGTAPKLTSKGPVGAMYGKAVNALTSIGARPFQTTGQKVVNEALGAAPMATLLAADPSGAAVHMGWNTTRELAGKSAFGKKVVGRMLQKGLAGEMPSKRMEAVTDLAVSPAFLDAQRFGKAVHDVPGAVPALRSLADASGNALPGLAAAVKGTPAEAKVTAGKGVIDKLRGLLPAANPAPAMA